MVQSLLIIDNQPSLDPTRSSVVSSKGNIPDLYVDWHYVLGGSRPKAGRSMPSLISVSNSNDSETCLCDSGGASWPGVESVSDINETSISLHLPTTITLNCEDNCMPDLASVSSTKAESDSLGLDYINKLPNHSGLHASSLMNVGLGEQQFHASERMEWYLGLSKGLCKSNDMSKTDLAIMSYNEHLFCACL